MENAKLITVIILIFIIPAFAQAAEECKKMEATFSWNAEEEEVASTFTVTADDIGKVMPGCSMFKVEDFSGSKLVVVSTQDESRGIITSSDVGKKPTYHWEALGTTETICGLKLIEFDGDKRSATFGVLETVEKTRNKSITSDDAGKWFELDSCSVKVNEFDVKSGKLLIDGMINYITAGDVGRDIFFDNCQWKIEKFGCVVEKTENISVKEIQDEKENNTQTENSGEISNENSKNSTVNESKDISKDKEEININATTENENKSEARIIKNENLNPCSGFNIGGFCIPVFALIIAILFIIVFLILMIFSLIKK